MHVEEAKRTLGSRFTWIVDNMDNEFKHAMGNAPNSEWVIDENNIIVARRGWSNAADLRADLEELVGTVETPTRVQDLDMPTAQPPKAAASGIVPRVTKPGRMTALVTRPVKGEDDEPFYAKLRAEAEQGLITNGQGTLYLRFMLDPLYNVHWNNLVDPIQVKVTGPDGMDITPSVLRGPDVEEEADIDPREFLVDVSGAEPGSVIHIETFYFACHETDGWCKPVTQSYEIKLERNPDGGRVTGGRGGRGGRGGPQGRPGGRRPGEGFPSRPGRPGGDRPASSPSSASSTASDSELAALVGTWNMSMEMNGRTMESTMTLSRTDNGLSGTWTARGQTISLEDVSFDGKTLTFVRSMGQRSLNFTGTVKGDAITGSYRGGSRGAAREIVCNGTKKG